MHSHKPNFQVVFVDINLFNATGLFLYCMWALTQTQLTLNYSRSTIETLENSVKYVER